MFRYKSTRSLLFTTRKRKFCISPKRSLLTCHLERTLTYHGKLKGNPLLCPSHRCPYLCVPHSLH
ncbi:hypothetical protein OESDEN_21807 [Oesophagostomum dentatum]|uniref:Uncharacterized protein n=1 Tax=Oesophagostomum dentatum TaxID=61180 RepID=A0A0B1S5S9_OESDE|nr:hypothetical protein OESDEN_21807 [Oesophagostomum dentatum]